MTRLVSYYGDDFTGSTDVMEALALHGVETVLFTRIPTAQEFAPYAGCAAVGLAGTSRSQSPVWMDANLPQAFSWLKSLAARFCHYKICSTFDSSPQVGSIGRAIDIAARIFGQEAIPLLVGAPQLQRYTFAGHLFAAYHGETFRIDRHPVMSRHPVTPMDESDLAIHLSRQTERNVRLASSRMTETAVHLIDVHDDATQLAAGERLLDLPAAARPFVCGSSGVEYALVKALHRRGAIAGTANFPAVPPVKRLLVVSGSVSPTTERQIRFAFNRGFTGIALDPLKLSGQSAEGEVQRAIAAASAVLAQGGSPLLYTALGPATDQSSHITGDRSAIGRALGKIARSCLQSHALTRLVVAGGDSSSHALAELDVLATTTRFPLAATPGSPLCTARTADGHSFEIALKGGQVGADDYIVALRDGTSA